MGIDILPSSKFDVPSREIVEIDGNDRLDIDGADVGIITVSLLQTKK